MCNKLLQTYACGHSKGICTTPCDFALKPTQAAESLGTAIANVVRSNSIVSSVRPVSRSPSRNFSRPHPNNHSPLRVVNASAPTSPNHVPAFRFIEASAPSPTSSVSPVSPSFANSRPPSRFPSPSSSTAAVDVNPEPTFCSYYIPRYLITSKYPCLECYGKEEWQELRARWMKNYQLGHPLDKVEEVEVLSGVADVPGKSD